MRGWCPVHGTIVDELPDHVVVEEPVARRRKDLYARSAEAWTQDELRFVRRHKDRMSVREMARRLNRSPKSVTNMLSKLHLRKRRVSEGAQPTPQTGLPGNPWTQEEDDALLGSLGVGRERSVTISHRSMRACYDRLWQLGEGRVTEQDGKLSARQVSQLYQCPDSRVERLIRTNVLTAHKGAGGRWRIDPSDAESLAPLLTAPKRTWKASPPDMGDYWQRYGLERVS